MLSTTWAACRTTRLLVFRFAWTIGGFGQSGGRHWRSRSTCSQAKARSSSTSISEKGALGSKAGMMDAPKRIFILALAGIVLMLAALDREVARLSRITIPRWTMERVRQSRGAQTIALGNSLIGVGFNETSFDAGMGVGQPQGSIN